MEHDAACHNSQDTGHVEGCRHEVDHERQGDVEQYMECLVFKSLVLDECDEEVAQESHEQAERDTAEELYAEHLAGVHQREASGQGYCDGELECDKAARVIEERPALQDGFLLVG